MTKVLVIDDDDTFVAAASDVLEEEGYSVLTALHGLEGMKILRENRDVDVLLLDLNMPDLSGEEILGQLREDPAYQERPVIIILTATRDVNKAAEMLEAGAAKFIVKPLTADDLISAVKDVIAPTRNYMKVGWTGIEYDPVKGDTLQGKSDVMIALSEEILRVAKTDSSVLILGETGSGKELAARMIHEHSERSNGPFEIIDCANLLNPDLVYSELWGHKKDSFTGATTDREGRVRQAEGGTIFLDEIETLDKRTQAQLLRFCQTREVWPLGSDGVSFKVDARIIMATNIDMEKAVNEGRFLQALYYRLAQVIINVPPLRERRQKTGEVIKSKDKVPLSDDIEVLVDYALDRHNKTTRGSLPVDGISKDALDLLKSYDWPGNVRQLNDVIADAVSKAVRRTPNRVITEEDIERCPLFGTAPHLESVYGGSLTEGLTELYKRVKAGDKEDASRFAAKVDEILNIAGGNKSRASELAGISRPTMDKYIEEARRIYSES